MELKALEDKKIKEELTQLSKDVDKDPLEAALSHVGEMGRYQKFLFICMLPFCYFMVIVYFVQMFVAATPQNHWCSVPELQHLDLETRRNLTIPSTPEGGWAQCVMYSANWSEVLQTMTPPSPDTPTVPCQNGWDFLLTDIPYHTVVSERGWVCEFSSSVPIAQAAFFMGSLIGGLVLGWLADQHGRLPVLVVANLLGCIGGVASVYTKHLWDFAFCRFLVGMACDSCYMIMYIILLEYIGPRHRTFVANLSAALFFGSGCLLLPWLALWIGDWRQLLLWTSLPMLIVLAAPFVIPESARWLTSKGRVNDAVKVLHRFEKINKTKIPQDVLDEFIVSASQSRKTDESMGALFSSGPLRLMMVYLVCAYMCSAIVFDGLVRLSENLGLDFFITFTFTSATEIPAITILALVLDRWGRRVLTSGPLLFSGALTLVAAFIPKGIPQVTLAILARFFINMSYTVMIQWTTELLPTPVRASGSSIVHVLGYIASALSPFIVYSERAWSALPLLIMSMIALLGAGTAFLMPETMGRPMPQTIAEGERLVRDYSICGKSDVDGTDEEDARLRLK